MSKYISPKLTITANGQGAGVTNPGPSSIAVNLTASPTTGLSTVTAMHTKIVVCDGTHTIFHSGSAMGECYLYLKNTSDVTIYVGGNADMATTNRTLEIASGEFAFMPWADDVDLYAESASGSGKTLEYFAFIK